MRTVNVKKLAMDQGIKPTAHGIAGPLGLPYETVRRAMNGSQSPSAKTMAAFQGLFAGASWDDLFILVPAGNGPQTVHSVDHEDDGGQ